MKPGKKMAEEAYADAYIVGKAGSEATQRAVRAEVEYVHTRSSNPTPADDMVEDLIYMGSRVGKVASGVLHKTNQPYGGMGDETVVPDAFLDATGNFGGDFLTSTVTGQCTFWFERVEDAAGKLSGRQSG